MKYKPMLQLYSLQKFKIYLVLFRKVKITKFEFFIKISSQFKLTRHPNPRWSDPRAGHCRHYSFTRWSVFDSHNGKKYLFYWNSRILNLFRNPKKLVQYWTISSTRLTRRAWCKLRAHHWIKISNKIISLFAAWSSPF